MQLKSVQSCVYFDKSPNLSIFIVFIPANPIWTKRETRAKDHFIGLVSSKMLETAPTGWRKPQNIYSI